MRKLASSAAVGPEPSASAGYHSTGHVFFSFSLACFAWPYRSFANTCSPPPHTHTHRHPHPHTHTHPHPPTHTHTNTRTLGISVSSVSHMSSHMSNPSSPSTRTRRAGEKYPGEALNNKPGTCTRTLFVGPPAFTTVVQRSPAHVNPHKNSYSPNRATNAMQ